MTRPYHVSSTIVCLLSFVFAVPRSAAGEEAEPAKRDIQFVLEDEPYVTEATWGDLHYAAIVRGFAQALLAVSPAEAAGTPPDAQAIWLIAQFDRSPAGARLSEGRSGLPPVESKLIVDYDPRLAPPHGKSIMVGSYLANLLHVLKREQTGYQLARHTSRNSRRHFLPAQDASRPPLQQYALFAPTVEEAKQFAEDFLHVYDHGYVPWIEKLIEAEKQDLIASRDEAQPRLTEVDKRIATASREAEGVEQLDSQSVSSLNVKRTLLKVDLAGVQARLSLIESKIKSNERPVQTHEKLVDLKVSADIELASLAAQTKVLDELIDGQRRLADLNRLRKERRRYAHPVEAADEGLQRCDDILTNVKPFQLIDNTVAIRPLRIRPK